ncbi:MAG: hypothetical protein ABI821_00670 [Pseudomonadota bacterium]
MFTLVSLPAFAAEDPRLSFLEQEVRNLNRQVQALSRQVDALRTQPRRISPESGARRAAAAADELPQWVSAAKWRGMRLGMSELEVIGALGPPTSMREEDGARVLLYALEIGATGFLGGSVTLRDRAVTEVRQPILQ